MVKSEVETTTTTIATPDAQQQPTKGTVPPVSPSKKETDLLNKATQFLVAGKRNLLIRDISAATSSLEEACRLFDQHYGEAAKECGEAYLYYGKSLLELARLESGVIDNAFEGVDAEDDENGENNDDSRIGDPKDVPKSEAEEISVQVDDAMIENCQETEKKLREKKKAEEEAKTTNGHSDEAKTNGHSEEVKTNGSSEEVKVNGHSEEAKTNGHSEEAKTNGHSDTNGDQDKKDSTEEDSKSEEESNEEEEEQKDKKSEEEEGDENEEEEGEEEKDDAEGEKPKDTESIGSNDAGTSNSKDDNDKVAVDKEEEDDPSNLQLSWEILELAKGIFSKHADSIDDAKDEKRMELESKLSEVMQLLGEVSIESENYPQAVEDLTSCLRRRQEFLPSDSRSIAETHYQLGVALGYHLDFDEAVKALECSIEVLETRVKNLKSKTESVDPIKRRDAFYTREKEIEEIEKLIPEIKETITDTRDMQNEVIKKIKDKNPFAALAMTEGGESSTTSTTSGSEAKPISNIGNLVKKRKKEGDETTTTTNTTKGQEENGEKESSPKKPHLETTETTKPETTSS